MACKVLLRISTKNSKTLCMSWSEVRPWHAKYFWGFLGNAAQNSKTLCMSWSEVRPWHATVRSEIHIQHLWISDFFWNLGHADITGQLISACHGLTSDRDMQISFGPAHAEWYKQRPFKYNNTFHFVISLWVQALPNHICMPRSEVRPWHADISWPVISACPKFQKNATHKCWMWISERTVACHGLTSDQDMQRVLEFWAAFPKNPQKYFACHGLTSDQDMQRNLEFWVACPKFSKVLCMPRSDLRPGHAKGLRILACLKSPKALCMPRSDLRPGHAKGLGILGCQP